MGVVIPNNCRGVLKGCGAGGLGGGGGISSGNCTSHIQLEYVCRRTDKNKPI